ncbi:hypothetical protein LINPERHAP1_LOCUS33811 [Linum perenne]
MLQSLCLFLISRECESTSHMVVSSWWPSEFVDTWRGRMSGSPEARRAVECNAEIREKPNVP